MWRRNYSKGNAKSGLLTTFILIVAAFGIFFYRQPLIDQFNVWQFQPSSEVSALAERSGIGGYGNFLYLASKPSIENSQNFKNVCGRVENTTSILGCYSNNQIYVYNVTDTKLDGVREVTAAHETLHAAYLRMSDSEKVKVDALLEAEYKKLELDKNFSDRMAFYDRTEPGQRDNELHSVIGTEVANISSELEAHYKQYFSDRSKVVALNTKYISVFQDNQNRASALLAQYNALGESVSAKTAQYQADYQTFENDKASFYSNVNNGTISNVAQYNSQKYSLEARIATLNTSRNNINSDINKQESIRIEYNLVVSEIEKLNNSLDSTLAPVPSV